MSSVVTLSKIGENMSSFTEDLTSQGSSVVGYFDISDYIPKTDRRHKDYRSGLVDRIETTDRVYMTREAAASPLGLYAACVCEIDKVPVQIIPDEFVQ